MMEEFIYLNCDIFTFLHAIHGETKTNSRKIVMACNINTKQQILPLFYGSHIQNVSNTHEAWLF